MRTLVVLCMLSVPSLLAQTVTLFDGKNLDAWIGADGSPPNESWMVEDGLLRTVTGRRKNVDLLLKERQRYFELMFEFRLSRGSNSGVKYFSDRGASNLNYPPGVMTFFLAGFEFQLIDNDDPEVRDDDAKKTGALYGFYSPRSHAMRPYGEWNEAKLVVRRGRVEHWINGERVLDFDPRAPEISQIAKRHLSEGKLAYMTLTGMLEASRHRGEEGFVGLQHHASPVWFRNIRLRKLD
ncbi:MAG: DUF1080 domain-containing protein [Bryobacterales bacterium]|nr:DUF1080 domain-containing protein [Bryobacterales bacterium]